MNSLTGIFLIVLSFSAVLIFANDEWDYETAYADTDFKEKVKNKSMDCMGLAKPDPIDVAHFFINDMCGEAPTAKQSTRCWISCIMSKMNILGWMTEGNKKIGFFDRVWMKKNVDEMRGGEETKSSFLQVLEGCAAESEQGSRIPCEMGYSMLRCYCRKLKQNKAKQAPRQGEGNEPHP